MTQKLDIAFWNYDRTRLLADGVNDDVWDMPAATGGPQATKLQPSVPGALPRAACAAASRAMGTRNGEQDT
jgi:hypothetical protein